MNFKQKSGLAPHTRTVGGQWTPHPLLGRSQCFPGEKAEQAARRQQVTRTIVN
jgi:hypothetical protein